MNRMKHIIASCVVAATLLSVPLPETQGGEPPKIFFEGSGTITFGPQTCLLFQPDESNQSFALGNTDGFGPDDRVWVSGLVTLQSTICFPVIIPAIEDNSINRFFSGCGEVGIGPQGCLAFHADNGEFFLLTGDGPWDTFERFFVTGIVFEDSFACFPFIGTELRALTADECVPNPDLNGDGTVNALDLLLLLQAWGDCPGCPEDLNDDDVVGLLDLLILLGAWG